MSPNTASSLNNLLPEPMSIVRSRISASIMPDPCSCGCLADCFHHFWTPFSLSRDSNLLFGFCYRYNTDGSLFANPLI